jgi:hypothetical protein
MNSIIKDVVSFIILFIVFSCELLYVRFFYYTVHCIDLLSVRFFYYTVHCIVL